MTTIQTSTTTYTNLTDAGRARAGKLLPIARHFNGLPVNPAMPAPRGISARKKETADKYHARIWAAVVKGQTDLHSAYIGRPDKEWTLRATDGHLAVFQREPSNDREPLKYPIATTSRPIAFELTADLELAIKRAKVVSAPADFITLAIGGDWIDVMGDDNNGTSSDERVQALTVDNAGAGAIFRIDPDLLLPFFGSPHTAIASVDTPIGSDRCGSLSIDYAIGPDWRYVVALAK
jgi:hypothetical protein